MKRASPTNVILVDRGRAGRRSLRRFARAMSALAVLTAGLVLTSVASSQPKPAGGANPAKPAAKGVTAKESTAPPPPPPPAMGVPAGAKILNEKGPGFPIVVATKDGKFPPDPLLGGPPAPAASSSVTAAPLPPSLPGPTGVQEESLKQLQAEAERYRLGATGYAKAIGQIIKQRYEQKRKTRLSAIQENIDRDIADLRKARLDTMERLKAFLAKYPDVPEHTPNAMFRLAALYEEQAVEVDVDPSDKEYTTKLRATYQPAEELYRGIINRFPKYSQRSAVQFFLGALLSDTGRGPESQWVWRALVCSNHYQFPLPLPANDLEAKTREKWKDGIPPMAQDHDMAFWDKWRETHYLVADNKATRKPAPGRAAKKAPPPPTSTGEESYNEVYFDDCIPLGGATTAAGEEPRFLSQTWWRIGEYHYSRGDETAEEEGYLGASPYRYNRAHSAYQHAIKTTNETVKVFTMYKLAWTLFKQQRYNAARESFLALLNYFDDKEKKGGGAGDQQMRQDAYDYIASSLTYLDPEGPGPNEPYIERDDVFGVYSGKQLEEKLQVAIVLVQDPKVVPQDKPWTSKIYKALASEFDTDEVQLDAIKTYELIIKKWDCDPEAPQFQNKIAQLYDVLALKAESQADKDEYAAKALEARTRLLAYAGKDSKWVECNKGNPDAIRAAESLMTDGVKNAAGRHTALGRVYISKAKNYPDGSRESRENLSRARDEYRLAERSWDAYLKQDPDAADAYESKYWIADSRHKVVLTTRLLNEPLSPKLVEDARAASVAVRDSNLDDKYLRYAAYFAVDVYDMLADEGFDTYKKSGCAPGVGLEFIESPEDEPGDACRPQEEKDAREARRIWVRDMPPTVLRTMKERDEYAAKVPTSMDADNSALRYTFQVADGLYRYGRFEEATPRYEALWRDHCGKDDYGFESWYRLGVMAARRGDKKRIIDLADSAQSRSCAMNEEQKLREKNFREPAKIGALYDEADEVFNRAEKETDPKKRAQLFREAAAKYELALKTAPSRPEAPRGAMNAAYCYKQVNEYKKAAEVYRLFLDKYGKEEDLIAYRDGSTKKGIKRDPEQFKTRLDYTKKALSELGKTYLQSFDYAAAAKHYDEVAGRTLLDEGERRDAAQNAVILQANLGNRDRMLAAYTRYLGMRPNAADKAETAFVVAEFEYKLWRQSPNDAAQKAKAATALDSYYTTWRGQTPAAKLVVDAAYDMATLRKSSGDGSFRDWYRKTSDAFVAYRASSKDALGTRESDYGAEAAYFFVNERIEKEWDTQPGQPPKVHYEGSGDKVTKQLTDDDKKRERYVQELEDIIKTYLSPKWTPVAYAREGSVYDTQRSALVKSKVEVLDPKAQKTISDIENKAQKTLDDPKATPEAQDQATKLLQKAADIRDNANKAWKTKRQQYYDILEPAMIDRYARAYLRGKQFDVKDPWVTRAVQRLAFYTDQLEDTKMRQYLAQVEKDLPPFKYRDQMFKQARPGSISSPTPPVGQAGETPTPPGITAPANTRVE